MTANTETTSTATRPPATEAIATQPAGMLKLDQIIQMLAEAYHSAALANANMRMATEALETIRIAMSSGSDLFAAWDAIDGQVVLAEGDRLQATLVRLREQFERLVLETEIARLQQIFTHNAQTGWMAWLRSFTDGLTAWRLPYCRDLCQAALPFPADDDLPIEQMQTWIQRALDDRWAEAYEMYVRLAAREFIPPVARAKLHTTAGEICLYHFLQPTKARQHFDQAMQLAPDDARVACGIGQYWVQQNDYEQAKTCYERAIQLAPRNAYGYTYLGEWYEKQDDLTAAEQQYQLAIKHAPEMGDGYQALLRFHGQPPIFTARKDTLPLLVRQLIAVAPSIEYSAYLDVGYVYQQNDQNDEAHRWYQKAITLNPARLGGYTSAGYLYLNQEELDRAMECFQRAIEVAPEAMDGYWGMSWITEEREDWAATVHWCEESLSRRPQWASAIWARIGRLKRELKQLAEAEQALLRSLENEPNNQEALDALLNVADDYYLEQNDVEASARVFETIRRLGGAAIESSNDFHNRFGNFRYYYADYSSAAEAFRKAVALKATDAVYHSNLALALMHLPPSGNKLVELQEAIDVLRRASELAPKDQEYADQLVYLERQHQFVQRYGEAALSLKPTVKPIQVLVESTLMPAILNPEQTELSAEMLRLTEQVREHIFQRFGITIPSVRFAVLEDPIAPPGGYIIHVMEEPAAYGQIMIEKQLVLGAQDAQMISDKKFALGSQDALAALGIEAETSIQTPPTFDGCWISEADGSKAAAHGVEVWTAPQYLQRRLQAVLETQVARFVDHQETMNRLKACKSAACEQIKESPRQLTLLTQALKALVREGMSIAAFETICERFSQASHDTQNLTVIVERLRALPSASHA